MTRLLWLGAVLVSATLFAGSTNAADLVAGKTYAVVVGTGTFTDELIKSNPNAENDAAAFAKLLLDPKIFGVDKANLSVLTTAKGADTPATKANILKAIKAATSSATEKDRVILFFVMQGATTAERPVLFAGDSTFKDRAKDGITATDLEEAVKGSKTGQLIAFVDVNLKATNAKENLLAPRISDLINVLQGFKEQHDPDSDAKPPAGRTVFLAGPSAYIPLQDGKSGLFTKTLIQGLSGKADTDGYEADGNITIDELEKYLEKEIPAAAQKIGTNNEEKNQRPIALYPEIKYVVAHNPEVIAKVTATLDKALASLKGAKLGDEVTEEAKRLLGQMPKLKAQQDLRKTYQKFAAGDLTPEQLKAEREKVIASLKMEPADAKEYSDKVVTALEIIKSNYIKKLVLGEMVAQGIRRLYEKCETPIPAAVKDQLDGAKELKASELKTLLVEARVALGKREDLDKEKDTEFTIGASLGKLVDPYTTYTPKEDVAQMEKDLRGRFPGIGVQVRRDISRDALLVITPIRNSPAYKAGLMAGDLITEVTTPTGRDGKKLDKPETISTKGMEVSDAVKLITGPEGTVVKLKLLRENKEGKLEEMEKTITRGIVESEILFGWKRKDDDSWDWYIDSKNKIAYMHLNQFGANSNRDIKRAIEELDKDKFKGLILDLRFNPGGYLNQVQPICDLFIDDGVIVSIRPQNLKEKEVSFKGKSEGSYLNFPIVVLINGQSASASEILAACLQDHGRAIIMGERSYGKGSVQSTLPYDGTGGLLKFTTSTFWPPSGKNLNKASTSGKDEDEWGVKPDTSFELKLEKSESFELAEKLRDWTIIPRKDIPAKEKPKEFKDRQLDAALKHLQQQVKPLVGGK